MRWYAGDATYDSALMIAFTIVAITVVSALFVPATGEPVFVPRSKDASEGEGYLLSLVYRGSEHRSDLAIFDAEGLSDGPVACAELPHRVPFGFHGNWRYND